ARLHERGDGLVEALPLLALERRGRLQVRRVGVDLVEEREELVGRELVLVARVALVLLPRGRLVAVARPVLREDGREAERERQEQGEERGAPHGSPPERRHYAPGASTVAQNRVSSP